MDRTIRPASELVPPYLQHTLPRPGVSGCGAVWSSHDLYRLKIALCSDRRSLSRMECQRMRKKYCHMSYGCMPSSPLKKYPTQPKAYTVALPAVTPGRSIEKR